MTVTKLSTPHRIPNAYVKKTQLHCEACIRGDDVSDGRDNHTCAYGVELYSDYKAGIFSKYSYVTDPMCPSDGHNWVHVATMSRRNPDGTSTNNCACGHNCTPHPADRSDKKQELLIASELWAHQAEFCTCYYEEKQITPMSIDERMAMERALPFVEIPMALVYQTMKSCEACQANKSQLEANHTCMLGTGELKGLMYLENPKCETHKTEEGDDGYGHYFGHVSDHGISADQRDCYACEGCEFKTETYQDLASNIQATRQMVMHRMSHCSCNYVDIKTWRIKRD